MPHDLRPAVHALGSPVPPCRRGHAVRVFMVVVVAVCGVPQMLSKTLLVAAVIALVALPVVNCADDEDDAANDDFAQLVLHKALKLDSDYMVVSKNFTVNYTLYNVGNKYVTRV